MFYSLLILKKNDFFIFFVGECTEVREGIFLKYKSLLQYKYEIKIKWKLILEKLEVRILKIKKLFNVGFHVFFKKMRVKELLKIKISFRGFEPSIFL